MSDKMDHDQAARADIAARPPVTGEGTNAAIDGGIDGANGGHKAAKKKSDSGHKGAKNAANSGHDGGNAAIQGEIIEPDALEVSAGRVISNAAQELRGLFGMKEDRDFSILLAETLSGMFGAIRAMSGRPWLRFAFAGTALGIAVLPPAISYVRKKKQEKKDEDGGSKQ